MTIDRKPSGTAKAGLTTGISQHGRGGYEDGEYRYERAAGRRHSGYRP